MNPPPTQVAEMKQKIRYEICGHVFISPSRFVGPFIPFPFTTEAFDLALLEDPDPPEATRKRPINDTKKVAFCNKRKKHKKPASFPTSRISSKGSLTSHGEDPDEEADVSAC